MSDEPAPRLRSVARRLRALVQDWAGAAVGRPPRAVVAVRAAVPLEHAPWDVLAAKVLFSHARNRQQLLGPPPTAFGQLDAPEIELLAAAAVAAAQAAGPLGEAGERRLRTALSSAGLLPAEPGFLPRMLRTPPAVDALLRQVRDPHVASLFYGACLLGADRHDPGGQAWLHYLAIRLRLPPTTLERLHSQYGMS